MTRKILINAINSEESRMADIKDNKLVEFHIEKAAKKITRGNIYKGVIIRIEPALQSVFVDYGAERNGFLQKNEIHSDYFKDNPSGKKSIDNLVKQGQELIVQVTKDPFMKKGAMLTTYISLAGRHLVLMPGSKNKGISRQIDGEEERQRLKKIVGELKIPDKYGIIVRTAGVDCSKTTLSKDLSYLLRLWKKINQNVLKIKAPAFLYKERSLVLRSLRDYFTPDVTEILVDDSTVYREVKDFIKVISPKHTKIVKLYKGEKPIFTKYELEQQISSIFENRVNLKSGGSIIIEQTEAMITIDVNSGKATKNITIEKTALSTNLEAAEELARQIRLRDLGGLIVIDFIDMRESKHKADVERALRSHLKTDKAKTKVGRTSRFGLIEMSRQRLRPSIEFISFEQCKYCGGKGLTPSTETLGLGFLRKLSLETLKDNITSAKCVLPVELAEYLLNKKRKELLELEHNRNLSITIESDSKMMPGENKIVYDTAKS